MPISREGISEALQYGLHAVNFLKDFFEKAPQGVKDKLPMFLGLSLEDERRWGQLWARLKKTEKENLAKFLSKLADYERNHFRHVVVGIPSGEGKTTKTGTGKDAKTITEAGENFALKFLQDIAELTGEKKITQAKKQCEVGGIILKDPISQMILRKWKTGIDWCERNIFSHLEITSWSELTPEKIKALDAKLANKIEDARLSKYPENERESRRGKVEIPGMLELATFGLSKKLGNKLKEKFKK